MTAGPGDGPAPPAGRRPPRRPPLGLPDPPRRPLLGLPDPRRRPLLGLPDPRRRPPLGLPDPPLTDPAAGITLRPWRPTPGDVAALAAAWADPEIAARTAVPDDRSTAAAARWLRSEPGRRAAGTCLDLVVAPLVGPVMPAPWGDRDAVLGEVGLRNVTAGPRRAEIGWWTAPAHRGRGLAAAAVRLLAGWALSPGGGFVQVWARIDPGNRASARVAERAGFVLLGSRGGAQVWSRARG